MYKSRNLVLFLILFVSCRKDLPVLEQFDKQAWVEDKNACSGKRTSMLQSIEQQKEKLLALSESEVIELLGRPDQNELYKRNQKFYSYFLRPAPDCTERDSVHTRLQIRFNAMGLAKEVSIE